MGGGKLGDRGKGVFVEKEGLGGDPTFAAEVAATMADGGLAELKESGAKLAIAEPFAGGFASAHIPHMHIHQHTTRWLVSTYTPSRNPNSRHTVMHNITTKPVMLRIVVSESQKYSYGKLKSLQSSM